MLGSQYMAVLKVTEMVTEHSFSLKDASRAASCLLVMDPGETENVRSKVREHLKNPGKAPFEIQCLIKYGIENGTAGAW